jgi:ribosomal protein S18 acetylase RimI-like enzyme
MLDMFLAYQKEKYGRESVVKEGIGFATYEIAGDKCYIVDIYIVPEARRSKAGTQIADEIVKLAKLKGCQLLFGTVALNQSNPESSIQALFAYGFKIYSSSNEYLAFVKDLE